jgi:ADP-dependent phosphofructokinase/glucokinase
VRLDGGEVRSEHPNRIIYVNDPPNRDLVLSPDLPEALSGARAFLPAGFNVMRDPALLHDRLAFLNTAMSKLPADAIVFYEDAGFHDNTMRAIVGDEFRGRVDVHSLNEDELQSYLGRRVNLLDVDDVVAALADFQRFAIAPTVVVHTKYWSLAHGLRAHEFGDALEGGIDLASTRYSHGDDFTVADLDEIRNGQRHPDGTIFAARIRERLGDAVLCIPSRLLDVPSPTTIGLGDTFVGGFLAAL